MSCVYVNVQKEPFSLKVKSDTSCQITFIHGWGYKHYSSQSWDSDSDNETFYKSLTSHTASLFSGISFRGISQSVLPLSKWLV